MYAKIYKYLFIKNYPFKEEVKKGLWSVEIKGKHYAVRVFVDDWMPEFEDDFLPKNEAELLHYSDGNIKTTRRVKMNKAFLKKLIHIHRHYSTFFEKENEDGSIQQKLPMV